ncbi:hypothetical protein [Xylanivirga thermophila]
MCYYEGDALKLPLEDNSVDSCISHTVIVIMKKLQ